jgi:hypothetical protein
MKITTFSLRPMAVLAFVATLALGSFSSANSAQLIPVQTYPMQTASPTPGPSPLVIMTVHAGTVWTNRLLDMQGGFAFYSSGDSFHVAPDAKITDAATGAPFIGDDVTGLYAKTTFSPDGIITAIVLSKKALPLDAPEPVQQYAVRLSTTVPNPDLKGAEGFTGAPVLVSFIVQVPISTSFTDTIYMSTEASRWDPMETRMDRVDALHYRITRYINSGTHVVYRFTRGTWRSAERGRDGLEDAPHSFIVRNLDVAQRNDTVYHWSDEDVNAGAAPVGPDSIPTPFSGGPFVKSHP